MTDGYLPECYVDVVATSSTLADGTARQANAAGASFGRHGTRLRQRKWHQD